MITAPPLFDLLHKTIMDQFWARYMFSNWNELFPLVVVVVVVVLGHEWWTSNKIEQRSDKGWWRGCKSVLPNLVIQEICLLWTLTERCYCWTFWISPLPTVKPMNSRVDAMLPISHLGNEHSWNPPSLNVTKYPISYIPSPILPTNFFSPHLH